MHDLNVKIGVNDDVSARQAVLEWQLRQTIGENNDDLRSNMFQLAATRCQRMSMRLSRVSEHIASDRNVLQAFTALHTLDVSRFDCSDAQIETAAETIANHAKQYNVLKHVRARHCRLNVGSALNKLLQAPYVALDLSCNNLENDHAALITAFAENATELKRLELRQATVSDVQLSKLLRASRSLQYIDLSQLILQPSNESLWANAFDLNGFSLQKLMLDEAYDFVVVAVFLIDLIISHQFSWTRFERVLPVDSFVAAVTHRSVFASL